MEERTLLHSWKEIADYLRCSVRTCHRWEEGLDLPVHRLDGTPKARVFAYPDELDRWKAEKLHSREEAEAAVELRRSRNRRIFVLAGVVMSVAAIFFLAWRLPLSRPAPPSAVKPFLAVLPLENLSGTKDLDWLRTGVPELITRDLSQSRYLNILPGSSVDRFLEELEITGPRDYSQANLARISDRADVSHLTTGSFTKTSEGVVITINLLDMRGDKPTCTRRIVCRDEEGIIDGMDELGRQIKTDLGLGSRRIRRDFDMNVGLIMTRSPEALKFFLGGLREYNSGSDIETGRSLLKKAIEIDPEFAMAYKLLGLMQIWGRDDRANKERLSDQAKCFKKALDLSDRVTIRERHIIRATYFESVEKDFKEALSANMEILRHYPDDKLAANRSHILLMRLGDWENALKLGEARYKENRTSRANMLQLREVYRAMRAYDKAADVLAYYVEKQALGDVALRYLLYEDCWKAGRYERALREADAIENRDPDEIVDRIYPYYLMGNYPAAEKICEAAIQDEAKGEDTWARDWLQNICVTQGQLERAKEQIALGIREDASDSELHLSTRSTLHIRLAKIRVVEGDLDKAMAEVDQVWNEYQKPENLRKVSSPLWHALIMKTVIYLEMGRVDRAQESALTIRDLVRQRFADLPVPNQEKMKCYDLAQGMIELKKGNLPNALDYFKKAPPPYDFSESSVVAASAAAYEEAGKLQMARNEYEKIPNLTAGRLLDGLTYALSFYRLGKLCERLEDRSQAIEYYGRFAELWKNADLVLPEIEDARARLASLIIR